MFVDPATGNFGLQPGSPAIGTAKPLVPFITNKDLGALPASR